MGVFARLLRRSKATEEATAVEAQTEATRPEPAAGAVPAPGAAGAGEESAGPEAKEAAGSDGVEIPQQQSSGQAADSEAGEGART